jgi:hypothetical protein
MSYFELELNWELSESISESKCLKRLVERVPDQSANSSRTVVARLYPKNDGNEHK